MALGTEVGVGAGDVFLDGDLASLKGAHPPVIGPCLLWPNGWMDEDECVYSVPAQDTAKQCAKFG